MAFNWIQRISLGIALLFFTVFLASTLQRYLDQDKEISKPLPIRDPRPVALSAKYDVSALPVSIAAGSTLRVLQLHPGVTQWLSTTTNGGKKDISWPFTPEEQKKKQYVEVVTRCDVTNHGEIALKNLRLNFEIAFYEGRSMTKDTIPVYSYRRLVLVDFLQPIGKPNSTFSFYLVNQSPFLVVVNYPREAKFQVIGESKEQSI